MNERKNTTEYLIKGRGRNLFSSSWDIFFFPLNVSVGKSYRRDAADGLQ